ncbi:hypothetical protein CDAR_364991 [Caerostris darwini]|uniref:Uncharacterized protein n=1 Tax=Caerostris darwini TaxID=1538125 RepID=A0AAV4QV51_9ARAC|nr:hypothetical protein CDAR_364991 [Caerostris darwini]
MKEALIPLAIIQYQRLLMNLKLASKSHIIGDNYNLSMNRQWVKHKSVDTNVPEDQAASYLIELINSLKPSGIPPRHNQSEAGAPIIFLQNTDH